MAPFFFVTFMLLFTSFMKNMFIAIIVAHYKEFQSFTSEDNLEEAKNDFTQMLFQANRLLWCPESLNAKRDKNKLINWYILKWEYVESLVFKQEQVNQGLNISQEMQILEDNLTKKYDKPEY